jgi:hypothetical protein
MLHYTGSIRCLKAQPSFFIFYFIFYFLYVPSEAPGAETGQGLVSLGFTLFPGFKVHWTLELQGLQM